MVQSNAAQGRDPQSTPLHVCQCPSCFTAFAKSNGVIECVPKCDLADCDESTGVCSEAGSGKGETSFYAIKSSCLGFNDIDMSRQCAPCLAQTFSWLNCYIIAVQEDLCSLW